MQGKGIELGNLAMHYTLSQSGVDLHLSGMPNVDFVNANLKTLINGISEKEQKVTEEIYQKLVFLRFKIYFTNHSLAQLTILILNFFFKDSSSQATE